MERSWRHLSAFLIFVALVLAGCGGDFDGEVGEVVADDAVVDVSEGSAGARTAAEADSIPEELAMAEEDDAVAASSPPIELFTPGASIRTADDYPETCSTSGLTADLMDVDASAAVNATRKQIVDALIDCDFRALTRIANAGDESLITDFGGAGVEKLWQAEANGDPLMTTLFELLTGPAATDDNGITSWPVEYSDPDVDYLDWRVGISDSGDWLFFIAGD